MKFSLDWLRSYVELPEAPQRVAGLLAAAGLPVDAVEAWGADHVLDVDVLSNRPDCMGHVGLARELAARLGRPLRLPPAQPARGGGPASDLAAVEIADPDLCGRYTAVLLTGVKVGPSPDWLVDRLASIGLRPINNLVDVTNFVLHELGQPLHAFDLDRLAQHRIVVRRAAPGETLHTLDGVERRLEADDLVIADGRRPVALAGIMGGADSEIAPSTTRVLLESAHFAPRAIRRTARRLGMHTDASHRFERGADAGITVTAALRAASLMAEAAGGTVAGGELDAGSSPERRLVTLSLERLARLLGLAVEPDRAAAALAALGFQAAPPEWSGGNARLEVTIPTWRGDVEREEDLIEEVARMVGYDAIPATLPALETGGAGSPRPAAPQDRARRNLAAAGFAEALNFPMSHREAQAPFAGADARFVTLDNPMSSQMDTLRASLLPGLLGNVAHNLNRGRRDVRLFEVGKVFHESSAGQAAGELPRERPAEAAAATGVLPGGGWHRPPAPLTFFDLKGTLEGLALACLGRPVQARPAGDGEAGFLDPAAASVLHGGNGPLGALGRLHPDLASSLDLPPETFVFELDLGGAPAALPPTAYAPLPRQPAADRDLALVVDAGCPYARIQEIIRDAGGAMLESVALFDRYVGDPVPAGKVSLAVRLVFRDPGRTLTADEVQAAQERIVERLQQDVQAELRDA